MTPEEVALKFKTAAKQFGTTFRVPTQSNVEHLDNALNK